MANSKSRVAIALMMLAFTVSGLGCATSGTPQAIGPDGLASLAGRWVGTLILPSGRSEPGTMDLAANGEYVARAGAFSAQGQAQVKDGNLVLVATATSGGAGAVTGPRSSVASLSQRPDGALVLRGSGHSETGPFDFDLVRQK